jgi:hypothetical protein
LPASADQPPAPPAQEGALADALYQEAGKLLTAQKWAEAKVKLEACLAIEPGIGVLQNLGFAEMKLGLMASSWSHYNDAMGLASVRKDNRLNGLREDVHRIEALLAKLVLDVAPENRTNGIEIRRDGVLIVAAAWDTPIPLDPGPHAIEASRPGKRSWTTTVTIEAKPGVTTVKIPALLDAPTEGAPVPLPPPPAPPPVSSTQRTAGIVVLSLGAVGLTVGAVAGGIAASKHSNLIGLCPTAVCPPSMQSNVDTYHRNGAISTGAFIAGGIVAATGIVVMVTAPKVIVSPVVGLGFVGARGRF